MTIAAQPDEIRGAVENGLSTKVVLANLTARRKASWHQVRIELDQTTGRLSDEIADDIIYFCITAGDDRVPLFLGEFQLFLSGVETYLSKFEQIGRKPLRVGKKRGRGALIRETRPEPNDSGFWFDDQIKWVTEMVWTLRNPSGSRQFAKRAVGNENLRRSRERHGKRI
jgi:hypothetical protein